MKVTKDDVEEALKNVEPRLGGWSPEQIVAEDIRSRLLDSDISLYQTAYSYMRAKILYDVYYGGSRRFTGAPAIVGQNNGMVHIFVKRYDRHCVFDNYCELWATSDGRTPKLFGPLADNKIESCVLTYLSGYINNAQGQNECLVIDLPEYEEIKAILVGLGVQEGKYKQ